MTTTDTTTATAYGRLGTYAEREDYTVTSLGAQWEIVRRLSPGNHFTGTLNLGWARTEAVRINGVVYRGKITYTYDLSSGDVDYRLSQYGYDWDRLDKNGSTRDHGLTGAAFAKLQNAARELHAHFPVPTTREVRDMIAEWAHVSARKSVAELTRGMDSIAESMGEYATGLRWTVAEAFAAEFRRAFDGQGLGRSTAWAELPAVAALTGDLDTAPGVTENTRRAEVEAQESAADEAERMRRSGYRTRARDRERMIAFGRARIAELTKAGDTDQAARYAARVAALEAEQN
jgi:hypothetical protein